MPFTTKQDALQQYIDMHEEEYSAIDYAASRVLSSLLDLELPMKTDNALKEEYNVCEAVRQIRESSRLEGRSEGKIIAYNEMGLSVKEISEKVGIPEEEVVHILKTLTDK